MSGVTLMAVVVASCSGSSASGWSGSAATTTSAHMPAPTTFAQPPKLLRPMSFSECLVAYGTMCLTSCGPRAATRGRDAHMPLEYGPGWVGRPCLRRRWSLWVGATATAEIPRQVAWDQPAVVEAAGTYAVQGGPIGDWTITSFENIASGPVRRVEGAEVSSGAADVQRDRRARAIRWARCASPAGSGLGRRAGRGRLRNAHRPGRPGRLGPSRMPRTCW